MLAEDASELVRRYIDVIWSRGEVERLDDFVTGDFTYQLGAQPAHARSQFTTFVLGMREAFPDWNVEIDGVVSEPAAVAVRWHARATHQGLFRGIPPTGRNITVTGINVYALEGNRIAVEWEQMDSLGMLRQLGVLPG